jgi:multidrug resistance efflux pump
MADAPDLDKLKADLKKLQNDIAALSKQAAAAQAAVKTAEAELAEIAKTADVYDTSGPKMQDELDDDKTVIARASVATTCCASTPGTGSRSPTTFANSRKRRETSGASPWSRRRDASN